MGKPETIAPVADRIHAVVEHHRRSAFANYRKKASLALELLADAVGGKQTAVKTRASIKPDKQQGIFDEERITNFAPNIVSSCGRGRPRKKRSKVHHVADKSVACRHHARSDRGRVDHR